MYYKIANPMTKQIFDEVIGRLSLVEVKGDSAENLVIARIGLRQLYQSLVEVAEEGDEKKKRLPPQNPQNKKVEKEGEIKEE